MHRARSFRFTNAACYHRFDFTRLDLHVDRGAFTNCVEGLGKGRNARPISEWEAGELRRRQVGDRSMRGPLWMPGVDDRIVVNDDDSVAGRVHIELDAIGAELDRADKRSDRVLGMGLMRAPVGDLLRGLAAAACGQSSPSVVALC